MQRRIPQIGIVMNSDRDLPLMQRAAEFLHGLGIPFEMTVVSPYRTPDRVREYGTTAARKGFEVIMPLREFPTACAGMMHVWR